MPKFAPQELEQIVYSIFEAAGLSSREARIVSQHLVEANLAGHDSHGVLRIPQYVKAAREGKVKLGVQPKILSQTPSTAVLDGGNGFGQVVASEAMSQAMQKSRNTGVAAVTLRNSYHTGRIASYTKMAALEGLVGLAMVNSGGGGQSVAPFGGLARRLSTNPLSIAAPSDRQFPIVLDIATSLAAEGKVRNHFFQEKPLPSGWIIDAAGRPATDPKDFYGPPPGALLPLGGTAGYKGFGLAFMVDILAGALSGAGCCRPGVAEPSDGLLMIVIDIERFIPRVLFNSQVSLLIDHVKSCPPAPGSSRVYVPGEIEFEEEIRRRREGIFVDDHIWKEIENCVVDSGWEQRAGLSVFDRGTEPLSKAV